MEQKHEAPNVDPAHALPKVKVTGKVVITPPTTKKKDNSHGS